MKVNWTIAIIATIFVAVTVSCSADNTPLPTEQEPRLTPPDRPISPVPGGTTIDTRPLPERMIEMVEKNLTVLKIAPDNFSKYPDAVHPDIACKPDLWNNQRCWLLYTPYHNGDASWENPSFAYAANDTSFLNPPGISNPIVSYPGTGKYNSDPDQAFDGDELVQVYREVNGRNEIKLIRTTDAKHWTAPVTIVSEGNHDAISPALVIRPDRSAMMWYVQSGTIGCNSNSTGIVMRTAKPELGKDFGTAKWSTPQPTRLQIPDIVPWHIDVLELPNNSGFLMFITGFPKSGSCSNSDEWLASSKDGINWKTYPLPLFWRSMKYARKNMVTSWYRGTMRYDQDTDSLHIWPSALSGAWPGSWQLYHTSVKLSDLMDLLSTASESDRPRLGNVIPSNGLKIQMP